jgi:uncharacterized protein (TIGR00369 family)
LTAEDFAPIASEWAQEIAQSLGAEPFVRWLGLRFEEIRRGYARARLSGRAELLQGDRVIAGGAIASAIDTVVIGAILSVLPARPRRMATIDLHVHYLDVLGEEDLVAEARLRRQGKTIVFVEVDARTDGGREVAHGEVSCRVTL